MRNQLAHFVAEYALVSLSFFYPPSLNQKITDFLLKVCTMLSPVDAQMRRVIPIMVDLV